MKADKKMHRARPRMGRAAGLLNKVLASDGCSPERLATELVVTPKELDAYCSGEQEMPLERQQLLALIVMTHFPQHARSAHALRAQVAAMAAYQARETERHPFPPPPSRRR